MIKHLITTDCTRSCEYCITRGLSVSEEQDLRKVQALYEKLRVNHDSITITGGEPTLNPRFYTYLTIAYGIFDNISVITASDEILSANHWTDLLHSITYSIHVCDIRDLMTKKVEHKVPTYASVLSFNFFKYMSRGGLHVLRENGYAGVSIREDIRNPGSLYIPDRTNACLLKENTDDFSIRIVPAQECLRGTYILPDLRVVHDFREVMHP